MEGTADFGGAKTVRWRATRSKELSKALVHQQRRRAFSNTLCGTLPGLRDIQRRGIPCVMDDLACSSHSPRLASVSPACPIAWQRGAPDVAMVMRCAPAAARCSHQETVDLRAPGSRAVQCGVGQFTQQRCQQVRVAARIVQVGEGVEHRDAPRFRQRRRSWKNSRVIR